MKKRNNFHRIVIGRAEKLSFVAQDVQDVPAKVDTGAYRSAVHAADIKVSSDGNKLTFVLFAGHPVCGSLATAVETDKFKKVTVANSFGQEEVRYEVRLRVKLGPKVFLAAFTLADRSKKIYPILLGRTLLTNRFVVDTSQTSIDRKVLKQKYGIIFPSDEEESPELKS